MTIKIKWMKFILTLVLLSTTMLTMTESLNAQVSNTAYNLLLKGMLKHSVPEINVEDAAALDNIILLDARSPKEYAVSHIKGAMFVDYEGFEMDALKNIDKNDTIVIYCSVGYRSEKVAEKMWEAGYKNVHNLYGGIFEWVNQDFPVVDANAEKTVFVHAYSKLWGVWLQKGEKVYE